MDREQVIAENADQISRYLEGISFQAFRSGGMRRDAIERCIERIIEVCVRIGQERLNEIAPGLQLHELRDFGDRLQHEYDRISPEIVWRMAMDTIPPLREGCRKGLR